MKKSIIGLAFLVLVGLSVHLKYLYSHIEFTAEDFQHAALLQKREAIASVESCPSINQPFF